MTAEPYYKYVRGYGWVPETNPVIYRRNLFALLRTTDVPEGVPRTVGRTMGDSVYQTYKELRPFPRSYKGPNYEDGLVCVVRLVDLPKGFPVGPSNG